MRRTRLRTPKSPFMGINQNALDSIGAVTDVTRRQAYAYLCRTAAMHCPEESERQQWLTDLVDMLGLGEHGDMSSC